MEFCNIDFTSCILSNKFLCKISVNVYKTCLYPPMFQYVSDFYRYLALVAALACEADFVFIPESPHLEGWEDKLCKKLRSVSLHATFTKAQKMGCRFHDSCSPLFTRSDLKG